MKKNYYFFVEHYDYFTGVDYKIVKAETPKEIIKLHRQWRNSDWDKGDAWRKTGKIATEWVSEPQTHVPHGGSGFDLSKYHLIDDPLVKDIEPKPIEDEYVFDDDSIVF